MSEANVKRTFTMSEANVKLEPTQQEDEEDELATPERNPVSDYQDAETTVLTEQEGTNEFVIPSDEMQSQNENDGGAAIPPEEMQSQYQNPDEAVQSSLEEDSVLNSAIIKTEIAVVVKSEDPGLASGWTSPTNGQGTVESTTPQQPRIRLVPAHRLSVRTELFDAPVSINKDDTHLPLGYFDELLAPIKVEPAPPNFFDELGKQLKEEEVEIAEMYSEQIKTWEIEEKYSEKVKILNELRENEKRSKDKKKHKKSKKKSRKRSRPRSRDSRSPTPKHMRKKRERDDVALSPPSTSRRDRSNIASDMNDNVIHIDSVIHISNPNDFCLENEPPRRPTAAADVEFLDVTEIVESVQPHLPVIGPDLTTKQKRDRILLRAKLLTSYLKGLKDGEKKPLTPFMFTSTVRKLPASHSFYTQNIYENRSPLHTINNVSYPFNSHRSQFNLEEWGLANMPPLSAKIAKLIGFDAEALHSKLKVTKIPGKIRNIKSEKQDDEDEVGLQSKSSLYCNATTQTDNMDEFFVPKPKGFDIGIQVKPASHVIACQTLETESPSLKKFDNSDNLPIMAIMRQLNENQLLALHDFAELLIVPPSNAMDVYCLRQKMQDIYKCSQLPSALDAPVAGIGNSYSTNKSSKQKVEMQKNSALQIQTLTTSHIGQTHSGNDARAILQTRRYRQDINNAVIISQSRVGLDPRNTLYSQRPSGQNDISQRSHGYHTLQPSHSQIQQPPQPGYSGTQYYGHGSSKR